MADTERAVFGKHPWSVGGGGLSDVKEYIEAASVETFGTRTTAMGFFGISAADEVMLADAASFLRCRVELDRMRPLVSGDVVRDWTAQTELHALFPYDHSCLLPIEESPGAYRWLWPSRTYLGGRATFSNEPIERRGALGGNGIKSPWSV